MFLEDNNNEMVRVRNPQGRGFYWVPYDSIAYRRSDYEQQGGYRYNIPINRTLRTIMKTPAGKKSRKRNKIKKTRRKRMKKKNKTPRRRRTKKYK